MEYRTIPETDLNVSRICIGTMTFGDQTDQEAASAAIRAAHEAGVNFIDTANIYPRGKSGESERITGKAVAGARSEYVLATKAGGMMGPGPEDKGLKKAALLRAADESLVRLDTDCIDLYYAHFPDFEVEPEELIEGMNALIDAGKIRYWGVSNFSAWQIFELREKAKQMGLRPPVATESVYNLLTRGIEDEMIPYLRKYPMGLVAYNPLAGGLLSGKYRTMDLIPDTRFSLEKGYEMRYWSELNFAALSRIDALAKELGISVLALSLKWLLAQDTVTSIISGFSKPAQLAQNIEVAFGDAVELPEKELAEIWRDLTGRRYSYHH